MSERVIVLEEPSLDFAAGQAAEDPHDGLGLFGPFSLGSSSHPATPPYVVLGHPSGLSSWEAWASQMNCSAALADAAKHVLWPPFPGFEVAFGARWSDRPIRQFQIDLNDLLEASRKSDPHERCFAVVDKYLAHFEAARKLDDRVGVAVCVVPDEVWQNCRPESHVVNVNEPRLSRQVKQSRKAGQLEMFATFNSEQYSLSPDFRRQLKARTMKYDIPVQILRESTLRLTEEKKLGERGLTPLSDRLWNLGTALYYKCGGKPWRLRTARDGVCYIGIAFRFTEDRRSACCAAQMFLDSGDGIVFLGEFGPWYSQEKRAFHLPPAAAEKLLKGVLETYSGLDGRPLKEIFLHCRSWLDKDEFEGFQRACPPSCKLVGVRVRPDRFGPRLFRAGEMPVLRGTFWQVNSRSGYLFGSGFKPRLCTYDGWETPVPLRIDVLHGDADVELVAKDILGLTKLNYNACKLGDVQPVTVGFSDAVGEILISNPTVTDRRPNFKYYI
jgi:hypothetical protein